MVPVLKDSDISLLRNAQINIIFLYAVSFKGGLFVDLLFTEYTAAKLIQFLSSL